MEKFICRSGQQKQQYNGYILITTECPITCWVVEEISEGKFKKRSEIMGVDARSCDEYGNRLYKVPESLNQLVIKAKEYIDNHIIKWANSPNNKINQK